MEINLKLTVEEVNMLLGVLGQMQNSSGTYPLLVKIKQQGVQQIQTPVALTSEPPEMQVN
jgi:hypothetical protein